MKILFKSRNKGKFKMRKRLTLLWSQRLQGLSVIIQSTDKSNIPKNLLNFLEYVLFCTFMLIF